MKKGRQRLVLMDELDERIHALEREVLAWVFRRYGWPGNGTWSGTIQDTVQTLERLTILRETRDD